MNTQERNRRIVGAIKIGYTCSDVARALGISRQRVHQVARAANGIWQSAEELAIIRGEMQVIERERDYHPPLPTEPMSPSEVAEAYGMAEGTVWKWVRRGFIRVVRRQPGGPGNKTLLDPEDLSRVVDLYRSHPGQGKNPLRDLKREAATPPAG